MKRKALLAERIRSPTSRPDLAPRNVPVGRLLHRPLAEIGYYMDVGVQDNALAGRSPGPGDARRAPPDAWTRAVETEELRRRRPTRSGSSTGARRAQGGPGRADEAREAGGRRDRSQRSGVPAARPTTRPRRRRSEGRRGQERPSPSGSTSYRASQRTRAHPVAVQRDDELADGGQRQPGIRMQRAGTTPPVGNCSHYHQGIDMVARLRDAGPLERRRDRRLRRLELRRRLGPGMDRDHRPQRRASRPGTPTCSRVYPVRGGQSVSGGQVIGTKATRGTATGAHLHWMVELNGGS